jgi:hypothetical protein
MIKSAPLVLLFVAASAIVVAIIAFVHTVTVEHSCANESTAAACLRVPTDHGALLSSSWILWAGALAVVFVWLATVLLVQSRIDMQPLPPVSAATKVVTIALLVITVLILAGVAFVIVLAFQLSDACVTSSQSVGCVESYGLWRTLFWWASSLAVVSLVASMIVHAMRGKTDFARR